jgi:hypothetical protein
MALRSFCLMPRPTNAEQIFGLMERELVPPQKVQVPTGLVYHYTDAVGLDGVLRSGAVHATHYRYMNDRTELDEGRQVVLEVCAAIAADGEVPRFRRAIVEDFANAFANPAVQDVTRDIFIASFSGKGDDLGQWRAYGKGGAGYAIGIQWVEGNPRDEPDERLLGILLKCEYDRSKAAADFKSDLLDAASTIERYVETYGDQTGHKEMWQRSMVFALRRLGRHWLSIKNDHFAAEDEWRLIGLPGPKKRKDQIKTKATATRGIVPYVELLLAPAPPLEVEEIVVGPTHDPESGVLAVVLLLESLGYDPEHAAKIVKKSTVPFRG